MAKKDEEKKSAKKADKGKRGKKASASDDYSSIATHPRARASVRRIKAWFGLGAFAVTAVLSLEASVPMLQTGERALIAGVTGYLIAWWFSILVWRQLMIAEQKAAIEEIERRRAAREQEEAPATEKT